MSGLPSSLLPLNIQFFISNSSSMSGKRCCLCAVQCCFAMRYYISMLDNTLKLVDIRMCIQFTFVNFNGHGNLTLTTLPFRINQKGIITSEVNT